MKRIIQLLISVLLLVFLVYKLNVRLSDLTGVVQQPYWLLPALLFPLCINPVVVNNRWKAFLRMQGVEESVGRLMRITFTSTFLGIVLPSSQGYDLLRIYAIEKAHPEARGKVGSTILVERLIGLGVLAAIGVTAALFYGNARLTRMVLCVTVVLAVGTALLFERHVFQWLSGGLRAIPFGRRFFGYLADMYQAVRQFPFNRSLVASCGLILLLQLSNIAVVYLLFRACGYGISFGFHCLALPIISLVTMVPVSFSGVGLREGAFVYLYDACQVPGSTAMAVSVMYYIVVMLVPAFIGGILHASQSLKQSHES